MPLKSEYILLVPFTADLVILNLRQLASNKILNNRPYLRPCRVIIDIYPRLPETHKRSDTYAAYDQGVYVMLGQEIDRDHASALHMALIRYNTHLFNLPVLNVHKGKYITMTEMTTPVTVQPAGLHRRNIYS